MINKPVLYTHDPAAYQAYSTFTSKKSLNTAFEMWLADYKPLFGRKELQALKTLETRKKGKDGAYINGPSIYVWQPYKAQNVTSVDAVVQVAASESKPYEINTGTEQTESPSQSDSVAKMSPHKALEIKTSIN